MIPLQETFDTVVAHLRNQNSKAEYIDDNGDKACKYLMDDGRTCAAGCLIKPEDYNPTFEGDSIQSCGGQPTPVGFLIHKYGHDLKLVKRLQYCHDGYKVNQWEGQFQAIAKDFGLTYVPKTN